MVGIVGGIIMIVVGVISRFAYVRRLHSGRLPSAYDTHRIRLLSLWFSFPIVGAIAVFAGIVELIS